MLCYLVGDAHSSYGHFIIIPIQYNFTIVVHNSESIVKWLASVQHSEIIAK